MKKTTLLIGLIAIMLFNCSYNSEDDLTEAITVETVTYEANVKSIIDNNCLSCHSDPPTNYAPMPLVSYENVKDAIENRGLINRISSDDTTFGMPLGGPKLPQNLIDIIIQWEEDGLLEN